MSSSFTSQNILITGGTSGIGRATALAFARAGANVAITGRREAEGRQVAEAVRALGVKSLFIKADAAVAADAQRAVAETVKAFGSLTIAFNNAGIEGDVFVPLHEQKAENYRRVMDINVYGVLAAMQAEIPALIASGGGAIVNTSSVAGLTGFQGMSVYTASKHAVIGLTRAAALEYAPAKIRVNAVCPGPIETEMFDRFATPEVKEAINGMVPQGRAGSDAEIANAVLWLCDPGNTYTTGQAIAVDGGFTAR